MRYIWLSCLLVFSWSSVAQTEHQLVRRISVFPVQAESTYKKAAVDTWWDIREALTTDKRFLVASKNFLVKKDVFQPRGDLKAADVIILSRLLDAHALVSTYLEGRSLKMRVYEGENGRLLWEHQVTLHPSVPISEQLSVAGRKLIHDFMASIPYQGFVVVDKLVGRPLIKEGDQEFFKAKVGENARVEVGDEVQVVSLTSDSLKPQFLGGLSLKVIAVGRIVEVQRDIIRVQLTQKNAGVKIRERGFVRLPREFKRLQDSFAIRESVYKNIDPNYLASKDILVSEKEKEVRPLATALGFISNIALMLLLAF